MNESIRDTVVRHVVIRGRVQGVGYRAWVEYVARQRALEGWVRNRKDGSVEAVFAGAADVVAQMVADCRHGPAQARIDSVDELPDSPERLKNRPSSERFTVLPTV